MSQQQQRTIDDRFTDLADTTSETMGKWWVSVIALIAILAWMALGPIMGFSDTWQLMINTPTTIIELFLAFFILAASNRVERRNSELLEYIKKQASADLKVTKRVEQAIKEPPKGAQQGEEETA